MEQCQPVVSSWCAEPWTSTTPAKRRKIEYECLPDSEEIRTRHDGGEHADVVLDLEQELNSLYSSFDAPPSHVSELHQVQQLPQDAISYYYPIGYYSSSWPIPIFPVPPSSSSSSSCSASTCSSCSSFTSSPALSQASSPPTFTSFDILSSSSSLPASLAASPSYHAPPSPTPMPPAPPAVVPPLAQLPIETATVTLTHKPRGSRGTWCPLDDGQRIRVTKGRGKRLRIEIRCRQRFDWPDVRFRLLDVTDADETSHVPPPACADFSVCNDRSTLQDEEDGGSTAVIEFHVSRVRVRLQCEVTLEHQAPPDGSSGGWTWQGRTATFVTHNNGKDRPPSRRKRAVARGNASSRAGGDRA